MAEKKIKSRVTQKHDTAANWAKAVNFVPKAGEVIIYDPDDTFAYPRMKVGDGETLVGNLNFVKDPDGFSGNYNDLTNKPSVPNSISVTDDGSGNIALSLGGVS